VVASSGTLALDELISNVGTVTVRASGSIKVTGALTLGSTATVNIALGGTAADQFGTIAVTGAATLAGTLNITLANGFLPWKGNSFLIPTYASSIGTFGQVNGLNLSNGVTLSTVYAAAGLSLKAS
jgi:hypothetical protein